MNTFDIALWGPGWASLAGVVIYGILVITRSVRVTRARARLPHRILVTGSRGKSGTVRLIHAALTGGGFRTYGKITGTIAVELDTHGNEHETVRIGVNGTPEIRDAILRASQQDAEISVFECMAVTPALIDLVQNQLVKADVVVIPTIRLDHLEEEGHTELEIALNILHSVGRPALIITAITQPAIRLAYEHYCEAAGIDIEFVTVPKATAAILGHHPVNIAIATRVARHYGVLAANAKAGMRAASREPEAATIHIWSPTEYPDRTREFAVIDLGGANDPQSAAEAIDASGIRNFSANLIPVIVNRWDRTLRSLSFVHAIRTSAAPVAFVTGTLRSWVARGHAEASSTDATIYGLSTWLASSPTELGSILHEETDVSVGIPTLVLLENVHNGTADALRAMLEEHGETLILDPVKGVRRA